MVGRYPPFRETNRTGSRQGCRLSPLRLRRGPGFTLIELLVVVGVITILLAVMIPSLQKAREAGRRAVCMGHLRQLQIAWYTYAQDHDGFIVCGSPIYCGEPHGRPWLIDGNSLSAHSQTQTDAMMRTGALASYVGDVGVYRCPSRYEVPWVRDRPEIPPFWRWISTYGIVCSMNCMAPSDRESHELQFTEYHGPSKIRAYITTLSQLHPPGAAQRMVFLDVGCPAPPFDFSADWQVTGLGPLRERVWTYPGHGPPIHHSKGTCVSFADGSVRYWKWKDPRTITYSQAWLDYYQGDRTGPFPEHPADPLNRDYIEFYRAIWGRP